MAKLTDKQKKKIIADYVETQNHCEVARTNNVSESTVRRIIKGNEYKEITKKCEQKKEENTQDMIEYLNSKSENKKRVIELCFEALENKLATPDMFTNIKDIVTVYGIIVDKDLKIKELQQNKQNNDQINNNILNIASLLNNPKPNRSEDDV